MEINWHNQAENGVNCLTAVPFSSFPRLLDSALLTGHGYQNRTFRIWGFFCAWLFVTLELACQIALTRLRILQPCAIGLDIWSGLAIECPTTVPLVVPHFSEAYQSGVCWVWNFDLIWRWNAQHSIWINLVPNGIRFLAWSGNIWQQSVQHQSLYFWASWFDCLFPWISGFFFYDSKIASWGNIPLQHLDWTPVQRELLATLLQTFDFPKFPVALKQPTASNCYIFSRASPSITGKDFR